jgi:hypothetical protein
MQSMAVDGPWQAVENVHPWPPPTGLHEKRGFRLPLKSTTWKVVNVAKPSVAWTRLLKSISTAC